MAEKVLAQWSYKGEKGYMPLVGHVKELSGMVVHEEFRDGNPSPGAGHVPFNVQAVHDLFSGKEGCRKRFLLKFLEPLRLSVNRFVSVKLF